MNQTIGTIGAAIKGAAVLLRQETSSPQLDSELLLSHILKQPREYLLAHRDETVEKKLDDKFNDLVERRRQGIPLAYITGTKEFYGRLFSITPAVLVPRPESEAIVDETLRILDQASILHPTIADIGTGSGVLAVSIAAEAPRVRIAATDISENALLVARRNARKHKVSRQITFIKSDLLNEVPKNLLPKIIIANLPYVPKEDLVKVHSYFSDKNKARNISFDDKQSLLDQRGLIFEPTRSLDGGPDGLFTIRRFFKQLSSNTDIKNNLEHLILEHLPEQRRAIVQLAYETIPELKPRKVNSFVTSWSRI